MMTAVCKDEKHDWCRGFCREIIASGLTGMAGKSMTSFGAKVKCSCECHIKYERY